MPSKFAANISTMFQECSKFSDRYELAKSAGFSAVECQFPYDYPISELYQAKEMAGVEQVLINSCPGKDNEVYGTIFGPWSSYRSTLELSISYAEKLGCKRIHLFAAPWVDEDMDDMEHMYISNLRKSSELLKEKDMIALIEPICKEVKATYFLSSFTQAVKYLELINCPNLKLQLDMFHLQMITGNLTNNITSLLQYTGHIQISQAPTRHEPNFPGEIDYKYILSLLDSLEYDGWIGLEYVPSGNSLASLSWIKEYR